MSKLRPLLAIGTRPEAIKLAPLLSELQSREDEFQPLVCLTGQHGHLLDQVTDYFGIRGDIQLSLMRPNQSLAGLTARCVEQFDGVLEKLEPDCVVVQGDTITVMAGALAAFFRSIPVVHVEAGLRSGDLYSPWPEELNRRIASLTTSLHCAPTQASADALLAEGVPTATVHVTGNTVVDALLMTLDKLGADGSQWVEKYESLGDRRMVLITGHRRESFGGGIQNICKAIAELATTFDDCSFVYPVHLNPNVQEPVKRLLGSLENVMLVEPVCYPEFVWLMQRSTLILSDSGGVQEESPSLKKPLLVMRDKTERPEVVQCGAARLVGTETETIVAEAAKLLTDAAAYSSMQVKENPFGDGKASRRIADLMLDMNWG